MSERGSVLIVEDSVQARNSLGLLLTRAGHEVAQATTGAEALRLARQFKPDLILLNAVLSDLSGLEVLCQIKADIEIEQTSVVLFSAQAVSADQYCVGLDTGADGYIALPIPDQELLARVRMHLRQHTRALRASEARFRDLLAHQADAVLVIDKAGLILFANSAAQTLYGRPASTLVGSPFDFPLTCASSQEIHLHRPGASDIVAEMRVAPSKWEGKPVSVASLRDISESLIVRRSLQDSENTHQMLTTLLKEEKERLLAAQAVASIGSWETDLATGEFTWSAQTHRIFETDDASFRPNHAAFLQLVHPDDRESVEKAFFQSLGLSGSYAIEHRIQLPDGRIKFVEERWQNFAEIARKPAKAIGTCHDITERKQAEQAQARLLNILETCLNEVYYFDPDSLRFAYVNPGALHNLGYALETMQAMTPIDLKPEFTEDAFRQFIAPLIRRERTQLRFETIHRRADGSHYPLEVILHLVERQGKQMLMGVTRDNTERRQAELARDESEDRFRLLWQTCPNAIVLMDRNSIIRYANPALQQVFGHAPATLIGNSLALLQPQHLAAGHIGGMRRHLETGQRFMDWRAVETIGLHKDGHEFPIEIAFSSMENGGELMFAGFMRDITERKQAELLVRESAERFRLLSKASRDAIWDWDLQADTLWWNEGYQELFGLQHDPAQTGVQEREAAIHPQDRERVMTGIRQAVAGSATVWSDIYRLLRGDGSQAQVDDRGYLIRDAAGLAPRIIGALTDVSAKVKLEEQLRQSQRLESIGQLTGGVAHDFNNLLTVILGNAELLQEALVQDPAHQELASMVGSAAQRGAELTQRLLAFARKQPLDPKPLDVNRLIDDFDPLLRRTLGEHIQIALARGPNL